MQNIATYLAWRYLQSSAQEKTTAVMIKICFISILIGSFALALVSAIMQGFETAIYTKMQGIHANISITSSLCILNPEKIETALQNIPGIAAISQCSIEYAVVNPSDNDHPLIIMLKGVDPYKEHLVSSIQEKIIAPKPALSLDKLITNDHVLIGKNLAEILGLTIGDTFPISYTPTFNAKRGKLAMSQHAVTIGGIFSSGIEEFDSSVIYTTINLVQSLFKQSSITTINVALKAHANKQQIIEAIREKTNLDVSSWEQRYPALVSALTLEKYAMFFIIALITLVASMNIVSLLFMQIIQKRPDIAILKVFGMPNWQITRIFIYLGIAISSLASLIGLSLAWITSEILERYQLIQLPDIYYSSHLPAQMEIHIPILVFIVVMLISIIATWIPARRIQNINIAQVLRFEG